MFEKMNIILSETSRHREVSKVGWFLLHSKAKMTNINGDKHQYLYIFEISLNIKYLENKLRILMKAKAVFQRNIKGRITLFKTKPQRVSIRGDVQT